MTEERKMLVELLHNAMGDCDKKVELKVGDKIFKGNCLQYNWGGDSCISVSMSVQNIIEEKQNERIII